MEPVLKMLPATIKFNLLRAKHCAEDRREGSCIKNETAVSEQVSDA